MKYILDENEYKELIKTKEKLEEIKEIFNDIFNDIYGREEGYKGSYYFDEISYKKIIDILELPFDEDYLLNIIGVTYKPNEIK